MQDGDSTLRKQSGRPRRTVVNGVAGDCAETNPGLRQKNRPSSSSYGRRFGAFFVHFSLAATHRDLNGFISPKKNALMAQHFHRDGDHRLPPHPMLPLLQLPVRQPK